MLICRLHASVRGLMSVSVSDVTVKVEVWDVVDKGRRNSSRQSLDSLKINFEDEVSVEGIEAARQEGQEHLMLDASTIDVMTGTHAVIFMVDPTKKWTFDYVMREMNKIPSHVWVLIVVRAAVVEEADACAFKRLHGDDSSTYVLPCSQITKISMISALYPSSKYSSLLARPEAML